MDPRLARRLEGQGREGVARELAAKTSVYLSELDSRPSLSAEIERKLIAAAKAGDRDARAQLIEAHLPAIAAVAKRYRSAGGIERLELLQEGVVGLLRAVERYQPERGAPFWSCASWWVRQAMQQLVAELTRPVVLSDRALRQLARIKDAHRSHLRREGREPTLSELAKHTKLSAAQVSSLIAADRPPKGLEEPLASDDPDRGTGTFGELLVDPIAQDEYERALADVQIRQLRSLLSGLSDRERFVLRARYGLDAGPQLSLSEIAARLGLSAERVRQIEQRALGKLRASVDPGG